MNAVIQYATSLFHLSSGGRKLKHAAAIMHVMFAATMVMTRTAARAKRQNDANIAGIGSPLRTLELADVLFLYFMQIYLHYV